MLSALSFTSPFLLLSLLVLPAIWFLLRATPPSPQQLEFPGFIILRQLVSKEETPERTPWQLLLLRLLIAALIIAALAGPVLNAPPSAPGAGPMVLVIDDSWAAAQNWQTRQDTMAQAAIEASGSDRELIFIKTASDTGSSAPTLLQPLTGEEAADVARQMSPAPFGANRTLSADVNDQLTDFLRGKPQADIRWLTDGVASPRDTVFARQLAQLGTLSVYVDRTAPKLMLTADPEDASAFNISRLSRAGDNDGRAIAIARDGRELARYDFSFAAGERQTSVTLDLPLALRNELSQIRLENIASAGSVYLADARDRQALIGLLENADTARNALLSGTHYVRQALEPYAGFFSGTLKEILDSDVSVIVLDDIGALRSDDAATLEEWVAGGGVLIRFAGPVLAESAQGTTPPLMPVRLRGGGRSFGGALTWDTPQPLDTFNADGPFSVLTPTKDVFIRQQVLAQPGGETTARTWAQLVDGTPLVTGEQRGKGLIALFHVTATPQWSDLPLSGTFVDMLRRLAFLSALGPESASENAATLYAPIRLLSGNGRLVSPQDTDIALSFERLSGSAAPDAPPGLYGADEAAFALNAVGPETPFEPVSLPGISLKPYITAPPRALSAPLFVLAILMFLIDGIATLWLAGKLRFRSGVAAAIMATALIVPGTDRAIAQPLDPAIEQDAADAALATRLAFVKTGDANLDRLSEQALAALSRELVRRTAIEPAPPAGVNLDTDDLSVYPFLYWPIAPGAAAPSDAALDNVENFMRFGGLILFDTRDDERAIGAGSTPEGQALQRIVSQLNIPALTPVPESHVLTRSFYLLGDLRGRANNNPVWVQAESGGANDGVTPVIIGGRDWAGAWAADSFGRPLRPMTRGGERTREFAYRAGVNMVMVAFTGNYKSDQVHTPILLERLGQ